jgi:type IV secretion system protein VirB11
MTENSDAGVVRQLLLPLSPFLGDKRLYEVVINRPGELFAEGPMGWQSHELPDLSFDKLTRLARAVASFSNQGIDETRPLLSATLPDGERVQIVIPPATTRNTVSITIRKPSLVSLSMQDMDNRGLFDSVDASTEQKAAEDALLTTYRQGKYRAFLEGAVLARKNIIVSGATGSGKTTLSKALVQHIPKDERLISIEDTPELAISQPNHVRLFYSKGGQGLARLGAKELLESCLRMRPDRVLMQELRDGTAFNLAFEQLTLLVKESEGGQSLDRADIRNLLKISIDVIVQCKRINGRFSVTEIYFADAESGSSIRSAR